MNSIQDLVDLTTKHLCFECTDEAYLKNEIKTRGRTAACAYCGTSRSCYSLGEVADLIERAFKDHYQRTADQPNSLQEMMLNDRESNYDWEREGDTTAIAIESAAEVSELVASDLQLILEERHANFDYDQMGEECEFYSDACYEEKGVDPSEWELEWSRFEHSLETESRLFNLVAMRHLKSLFADVQSLATQKGNSLVVAGGPGSDYPSLFRARAFQSDRELTTALARPDQGLGPPPPDYATAGRMNAKGIAVFYGASTQEAALAEVRPPVGSQVAVARFNIIRPLRLLDLTAFDTLVATGSIFDPTFIGTLEKASFLRTLGRRLSKPVMPNDADNAYLATQAVAEFLANEEAMDIDGLIFPAVQAAGGAVNVVLFHKASRVKLQDVPSGTKIEVELSSHDEDGPYPDYSVIQYPSSSGKSDTKRGKRRTGKSKKDFEKASVEAIADFREETLQIVDTEVEVHVIRSVSFTTDDYSVHRHHMQSDRKQKF